MKRLLWILTACGFVAFIGIQTAHDHDDAAAQSCQICVISRKVARHVPAMSPAFVKVFVWAPLPPHTKVRHAIRFTAATSARAPPHA